MELKELVEKTKTLFIVENVEDLAEKIFDVVRKNDAEIYEKFCNLVEDLNIDWMQMIYQYYLADRKEKKQDYTPKSLARLMGRLAGESDVITDMCAGSGALTIQKWSMNHTQEFELWEIDENVIPYLLFNMAIRNIGCTVYHGDVLKQEVFNVYRINRSDKYGKFKEITE